MASSFSFIWTKWVSVEKMFVLALLGAALLAILCAYGVWTSTYWRRHGVRGRHGLPLCGNMWRFLLERQHFGDFYEQVYKSFPELSYVGIYRVFNEPAILVRSQELVKEVMVRSFSHFRDNVLWVDPYRDPIIWCNPFVTKGEEWKQLRSELVTVFTPNKVKLSFPHVKTMCGDLAETVAQNLNTNCFEVKELFSKYTFDVVLSAAYGLDAESFVKGNSDLALLVKQLFLPHPWSIVETIALLFSPTVGHLINFCYMAPMLQRWLRHVIGSVLQERLDDAEGVIAAKTKSDFIQWLIEAKRKQNESVDRPTIVGHCATFLVEGFETSSSLMAFALFEYAKNQHIQQRVFEEINEVLGRFDGELSYEALQEMNYTEATLYETLRLYPPMKALLKHCTESVELPAQAAHTKPFTVPVGTVFVIPVQAIHNDAEFYPEPSKFKPERFENLKDRQQLGCKFLGFGGGPRMCPGMRFGLLQSKAGLVTLLAKYYVRLADKMHLPLKISTTTFLTATKDGIWLSFEPRK